MSAKCGMIKAEVFYFSATGNSLFVARDVAQKLGAKLTPIAPLLKRDRFESDADVVGFVFPIYDFNVPRFISAFVRKFPNLDSKYVFAVATFGLLAQDALKKLDGTLRLSGAKLSAGFVLHMPNNGIITEQMTLKRRRKIEKTWNRKLEELSRLVSDKQLGKIETTNTLRHMVLNGLFVRMIPKLVNLMVYVRRHGGWDSLKFVADEKCVGCEICTRVCPTNNIALGGGRPSWGKNCLYCFACINWCPQKAIQAGTFTVGKKRYNHPDVTFAEIADQKRLDE